MKSKRSQQPGALKLMAAQMLLKFKPRKLPNDFLAVLNYHQVSDSFNPRLHWDGNWTQTDAFERTVLNLKKNFQLVRLDEAIARLEDSTLKGPCVALTFDDGDISIQTHIAPLLERLKVPASFFINTAYQTTDKMPWTRVFTYLYFADDPAMDAHIPPEILASGIKLPRLTLDKALYGRLREALESKAYLVPPAARGYASLDFLRSLDDRLFMLGLHGHEHQRFSMLSHEAQVENIEKNIEVLSTCKAYRPYFALPYGRSHDWNDDTIRICMDRNLKFMMADGGVNFHHDIYYARLPADSKDAPAVIRYAIGGR